MLNALCIKCMEKLARMYRCKRNDVVICEINIHSFILIEVYMYTWVANEVITECAVFCGLGVDPQNENSWALYGLLNVAAYNETSGDQVRLL